MLEPEKCSDLFREIILKIYRFAVSSVLSTFAAPRVV
jgi:hypothetical protein